MVESSDERHYFFGNTLEGTITSWNQGAKALYGYRPDEMVGRIHCGSDSLRTFRRVPYDSGRVRGGDVVQTF